MDLKNLSKIDLDAIFQNVVGQFKYLDPKEPGEWPIFPKFAAWLGVVIAVVAVGWLLVLNEQIAVLNSVEAVEPRLKDDYRDKLTQAVNLDQLKRQKEQVQEYVVQLEKQLPGKADIDALLSDINQAGLGRGLQFELFRPSQTVIKNYYAELPISIRVTGKYHEIGAFAGDVANLSRIVTLHNITIIPASVRDAGSGILAMEATARTYRYLDPNEVAAMRKAALPKNGVSK